MTPTEKRVHIFLPLLATAVLLLTACQPSGEPSLYPASQDDMEIVGGKPTHTVEMALTPEEIATPQPQQLIPTDIFTPSSPFCQPDEQDGYFLINCDGQDLIISQSEDRRGVDMLLSREIPVETQTIDMAFDAVSTAAETAIQDQNQYGAFFIDENDLFHALRISGQQFSMETWSADHAGKVEYRTNPVFSPLLKPAGQPNHLRWLCGDGYCDFFANDAFAARMTTSLASPIRAVGLFAASRWDQRFGQLVLSDFQASEILVSDRPLQPFLLSDDLREDRGLFSQTILSGAFDLFSDEGFHFSPLIQYGYYSVRGGPALGDSSVEVTIKMEVNPQRRASQYAGITCRSSMAGMYMAVIRADGIYFIYRDTPSRPFALLAKRTSEFIHTGLTENRLRLDCVGSQLNFHINDTLVESIDDGRFGLNFGRAGLFTKAGGDPNPDAFIFSDFSVQEVRTDQ